MLIPKPFEFFKSIFFSLKDTVKWNLEIFKIHFQQPVALSWLKNGHYYVYSMWNILFWKPEYTAEN